MLLDFSIWLSETEWSIALRESLYLYPWIESAHVLSISLFVGTLIFIELRLIGLSFLTLSISELNSKILPISIFGFCLMTLTGALLFYAIPVRTYQSIFFRIKILLIILAGINAFLFHRQMYKEGDSWDEGEFIPSNVKIKAVVSLVLWIFVIISGRMIAYNWFDCDKQPQPDWVNWAAGCLIEVTQLGEI
tara:strand:- start:423 stop:995 length:573 start_codon:yes stop_codon:yes gene_type:complete